MKKYFKRSFTFVMLTILIFTSTALTAYAEDADSIENTEKREKLDYEAVDSGDTGYNEDDIPVVDSEEAQVLTNKLPEELTGMDENGEIYSLDENAGMVQENIRLRAITAQVVNFNTKGFSATTLYKEVVTGIEGYTCGAYGADAAYLGTSNGKVKFMLSGVIGEVASSEVQVISCISAKSLSHYIVSGGKLLHKISTNMNSESYGSTLDQGNAPSYLQPGQKYYSYDGHYFYTENDYALMLEDYNNGSRSHSVNPNKPYYNYFQYLPFRSQTNYTGTQLNTIINNQVNDISKMKDIGSTLAEVQNTYGTNALIMTGVAANESNWGKSNIAQTKNNLFGMNAVDSSPGENANYYSSINECIKDFSETYMSKQYLSPLDWKYFGGFLGNKASGINLKYASDPYWGEKAANIAWMLDRANGNMDVNKYALGIKDTLSNQHTALNIRKEATTASAKLYSSGIQSSHAFIILGESANFCKIQSDPVLNSGRTAIDKDNGKYNYDSMYAYASKDYISYVNDKDGDEDAYWNADDILINLNSPQAINTEIQISAKISGNTNGLKYKFVWMKDNWADWGVIQDSSSMGSTVWVPQSGGNYRLYMDVCDSSGKVQTVAADYVIKTWGIQGVDTDLKSPQVKNSTITITPQMLGKTEKLQYKFVWMRDNWADWGIINDFSPKNNIWWQPKEAGEYKLYIDIKDQEGFVVSEAIPYTIVNKLWIFNGINVDKEPPQELGMPLTISADMDNVEKGLQYKFVWMKDNWSDWGVIQEFSEKSDVKWTPEKLGEYCIYVDVRDKNKENVEHHNITFNIVQGNWKLSDIQTNPVEFQKVGDSVQLKTQIFGNRTGLEYKFVWMRNNWSDWGVIQDFSSKDTVTWKTNIAGDYHFYVDVRDLTGRVESTSLLYEISNKAWKYKGIEVNQISPQEIGTNINIKPIIFGTTEGLQYKYLWMKDDWGQWGVIKQFSESSSISWIPKEVGEYRLYIDVSEKNGKNLETQWIQFTVTEGTWEIAGLSFDLDSPQIVNTEIEIASRIIGNKTGLTYKFVWMKDGWKDWGVIQDKGEKSKAAWKPSAIGRYKIYLDVFDTSGKSDTYVYEYDITEWQLITKPLRFANLGDEVLISMEGVQHNKNLEYKFVWMMDNWTDWGVIQDYSEKQTAKWTPKKEGMYYLYVDLHNTKTGEYETKKIGYVIRKGDY